jgi:hypothetical protein
MMTRLLVLMSLAASVMAVPIAHLDAPANVNANNDRAQPDDHRTNAPDPNGTATTATPTLAPTDAGGDTASPPAAAAAAATTTKGEMHVYNATTAAPPAANSSSSNGQPAVANGEGSGSGSGHDTAAGDSAGGTDADAAAAAGPCKAACTPKIDANASVIESYKRRRAQAALIGDWGDCVKNVNHNSSSYTWAVDWGDDESYEHKAAAVGPYQAEHVYHKKGKYTVEVTYCHSLEDTDGAGGCTAGCATFSKMIHVKP